jgi:hypothetical protein
MDTCYDVLPLLLKRWVNWQDCAQEYTGWAVKYISKFPLHDQYIKSIRIERGRKDRMYYLYIANEQEVKVISQVE